MSGKLYTEELKIAAVKQVALGGHPASEVAARVGISVPQPIRLERAQPGFHSVKPVKALRPLSRYRIDIMASIVDLVR
ncbi:hypothetical protein [Massilia litorea]|uniref:Transposase n=1 Tax=Massilia litorea TaxID=2769491 RepID=A0A7L9UBQ4_9BURK|nr:hypothetical protein [Massilia litorea]QOL52240.1 hypothetical protein LPB04_23820 [Massilia litorea]